MKYLVFDLECCDGKHICEFGYVLFDETFTLLARDCITIDPEMPFQLGSRDGEDEISLAFPEVIYYSSPTFAQVYPQIKEIIETPDCQIIGFSFSNDTSFLARAYARYQLEPIRFSYLDFQKMYRAYAQMKNHPSVERIVEDLAIEDIILHKSDDDSHAVMRALEKICAKENLSLPDTLQLLQTRMGNYRQELAKERNQTRLEKIQAGNRNAQKDFITRFMEKKKPNENASPSVFFGKRVSVSMTYQRAQFDRFIALLDELYRAGATYCMNPISCDLFLTYEVAGKSDRRYAVAQEARENGKPISFLTVAQALLELGVTEAELDERDLVEKMLVFKKKTPTPHTESAPTTLGEMLKAKGVDLSKMFS